jgi:pyochelin synthetase
MSDFARRIAALSPEQREALLAKMGHAAPRPAAPAPGLPPLVPRPADRDQPFPLTDVQQVYRAGRSGLFDLGTPGVSVYLEYELEGWDESFLHRLDKALERLFDRHEILRLVMLPDGLQRLCRSPLPGGVEQRDLRGLDPAEVEVRLAEVRARFRYHEAPPGHWPLFGFLAHRLDGGRLRLHAWIDAWLIDGLSRDTLMRDLFQWIADPGAELPPLTCTYRDYALAWGDIRGSAEWRRARDFWLRRIPTLPAPPELPLAVPLSPRVAGCSSDRFSCLLEPDRWQRFQAAAQHLGVTPSLPLIAAFVEVLRAWTDRPAFLLALDGTYWPPVHPRLREVVGNFNTVYLLAADDWAGSFSERVRRLQGQLSDILDHRIFSGFQVLRELRRRRGAGTASLLPVNFNSLIEYNHPSYGREERNTAPLPAGLRVTQIELGIHPPQILLMPAVFEGADRGLFLKLQAVEEAFPAGLVADLVEAYTGLVQRLAEGDAKVWERKAFALSPAAHIAQRTAEEPAGLPAGTTLHGLFAARAAESPDAPALASAAGPLSRHELAGWAACVAQELRELGAAPGEPVALAVDGAPRVAALLGVLASGAACLPVDSSWPSGMLRALLRQARVRYALTAPASRTLLEEEGLRCLVVDRPERAGREEIDPTTGAAGIAWIVPSGEPGESPLVAMDHLAVAALLTDFRGRLELGPGDRLLALSPPGTDLSLSEILGALAAGATVLVPERGEEAGRMGEATVWSAPPAVLDRLLVHLPASRRCGSLRLVLLQRGTVPVTLPDRLRALEPGVRVVTLASLPETGMTALHQVGEMSPGTLRLPMGRPLAGVSFHVLDHAFQPRPDWVPGELWVDGPGLARGYREDDTTTRERFLSLTRGGGRLFRTGLRARFLPGGTVELLGRDADYRVEIGGRPVDPRWTEAALERHPEVRAAAVRPLPDARGRNRLEAWVVPAAGRTAEPGELAIWLRSLLPSYLVPHRIHRLPDLPLGPTGEVDDRALAAATEPLAEPASGPPCTFLERHLAGLWTELLGAAPESLDDDFFASGGDSFSAVLLLDRAVEQCGGQSVLFDLSSFFAEPTLRCLTKILATPTKRKKLDECHSFF